MSGDFGPSTYVFGGEIKLRTDLTQGVMRRAQPVQATRRLVKQASGNGETRGSALRIAPFVVERTYLSLADVQVSLGEVISLHSPCWNPVLCLFALIFALRLSLIRNRSYPGFLAFLPLLPTALCGSPSFAMSFLEPLGPRRSLGTQLLILWMKRAK